MTSQVTAATGEGSTAESASTTAEPTSAATPDGASRINRADRWGWLSVAALTAIIAATWLSRLNDPLGDNHMGRIIGRYALHLRNLEEKGLVGSHFTADWSPYVSVPYAHHPPLMNILTAIFGALPGRHEYEFWLPAYLLALLIIPASAALLRGFGIGWTGTLLTLGLTAGTTFYWVYSPLMFDLGPILLLSAAVVQLRQHPTPPRWLVVLACVAALLTTLVSWPGIAFAAALGLWLFAGRRLDRVTVLVGAIMVVGVVLSLVFIVGVSGLSNLSEQTEMRTAGGNFTAWQFVKKQWGYLNALLPVWYLVLLPFGVVAGLLNRRTRLYVAIATAFTAAWIIVFNNGAWVHSYWTYPMLILGLVGMGVLVDWLARRIPKLAPFGAGATGLIIAAYMWVFVFGTIEQQYITNPTKAGELVSTHLPPAGQQYAWMTGGGLSAPRWLVYYWDLRPKSITPEVLASGEPRPEDLVLMDVRRRPDWLPESINDRAVARDGNYALFRVADLQAAAARP